MSRWWWRRVEDKLDLILEELGAIKIMEGQQMADLTRITQEVTEATTVMQSAVLLLEQLAELIRQNASDPAALAVLADQLDTNANALAAAVEANTPPPPPQP